MSEIYENICSLLERRLICIIVLKSNLKYKMNS